MYNSNSDNNNYYSREDRGRSYLPKKGMPEGYGCWAKCLIESIFEYSYQKVIEYTGNNFDDPTIEMITIQTKPKSTKWIKKKADPDYQAANPSD
jgi:hypothetical protein